MAISIEWRREPDRQHTGSAELRGVSGTPFLYVHPQDMADAPRGSAAGWWWFDHRDTTVSPEVANPSGIYVDGSMSYAAYFATRALYRRLSSYRRFAIAIVTNDYRGQEGPGEVFMAPVATSIQVSGACIYKAYVVFDPPLAQDVTYETTAELWAFARGRTSRGARIGMGRSISSAAAAFDHAGVERGATRAIARLAFPRDRKSVRDTVTYDLEVAAGTREIHIGTAQSGPGFSIASGRSAFVGWAEIAFTLTDSSGKVLLEPASALEGDESSIGDTGGDEGHPG